MGVLLMITIVLSMAAQDSHQHPVSAQGRGATAALSEEQVAQLLTGEGMGLARPAELNHYPGPKHVLELASELGLSAEQRAQVEAIRTAMLVSAKRLGAAIVEAERALDSAFASESIDEARLGELTSAIVRLQGDLRAVHLRAHLQVKPILSSAQIAKYDELRGHARLLH
jgi:Spy/CpxP family protein refolding chaperone